MRNDQVPEITRERARSLRHAQTPGEVVLWAELRARRAGGVKFRRQVPIGPFILDFYCVAARFAVELDGWVHEDPARRESDRRRTRWLAEREGIAVFRFRNEDVATDVGRVCDEIVRAAEARMESEAP